MFRRSLPALPGVCGKQCGNSGNSQNHSAAKTLTVKLIDRVTLLSIFRVSCHRLNADWLIQGNRDPKPIVQNLCLYKLINGVPPRAPDSAGRLAEGARAGSCWLAWKSGLMGVAGQRHRRRTPIPYPRKQSRLQLALARLSLFPQMWCAAIQLIAGAKMGLPRCSDRCLYLATTSVPGRDPAWGSSPRSSCLSVNRVRLGIETQQHRNHILMPSGRKALRVDRFP